MDTKHQQHKLACERALDLYAAIEAAIDDRRIGFAQDTAKNLKAFLENRGDHVFKEAAVFLPDDVTLNWRVEAEDSKSRIERYLYQLEEA